MAARVIGDGLPMSHRVFYLVRHGVTDWNEEGRLMGRSDVELNVRGRAQAERAAAALASESIAAVYSSPQIRARQTAAPIAESRSLEVIIEPGFDEVWLSDAWTGKRLEELRGDPDLEKVIQNPAHECDALEPLERVQERAVAALESLRQREPRPPGHDGALVIVSHGDPLRAIVAHYLGLGLESLRRFAVDNGSLTSLRFGSRGPRLLYLNTRP